MRPLRITRLPKWTWTVWVLAVALSFLGLETLGLLTAADGDTLSEWTRAVLGIYPAQPWRIAGSICFAAVLLVFVAWFLPHIVFRFGWWQPFKRRRKPAYPPVGDPDSSQVNDSTKEAS